MLGIVIILKVLKNPSLGGLDGVVCDLSGRRCKGMRDRYDGNYGKY